MSVDVYERLVSLAGLAPVGAPPAGVLAGRHGGDVERMARPWPRPWPVRGVAGVVAYDSVTGRAQRLALPGRLGADPQQLAWLDDVVLVVSVRRADCRA